MKRKVEIGILCLIMLFGCLAGCGNGEKETVESEVVYTAKEKIEIWYYWETEGHQVALHQVIQDYNAQQDRYEVELEYVPFPDFKKQLSIGASSDKMPDMVIIDSPDHAAYAAKGIFADLTDKIDVGGYYEATVASCTLDDKLYGVPFGCNCLALYYNEDMLKASGIDVPKTWDELKTAALSLSKGNVTGFAMSSVQDEEGTFGFMPFLWSAGATYDTMGSEGAIRALTLFQDLVRTGAMSKECINWRQADVMSQFIDGNVAMMINGPWQIPTMEKANTEFEWKVTLIPMDQTYTSAIGGENYAIIEGGNEEGALAFLEYATKKENVEYLVDSLGYIAAQKEIAATQFDGEKHEAYQVFTQQLSYARARGPHKNWPDISDSISLAFNQVITEVETPEAAAQKAAAAIDEILKRD